MHGSGGSGGGHHSTAGHHSTQLGGSVQHGHHAGISLGQVLGLGNGHGGGSFLSHLLGLDHNNHGAGAGGAFGHHMHHGGEPDQSPSWNMAMQAKQTPLMRLLNVKIIKFTPGFGLWSLFVLMTLWLGVVYHLSHSGTKVEPLSNQFGMAQISAVAPSEQPAPAVPTIQPYFAPGATLAAPASQPLNYYPVNNPVPLVQQAISQPGVHGTASRVRMFVSR